MTSEPSASQLQSTGVALHSGQTQGYTVAGFESRDHLAASVAPSVRDYLARSETASASAKLIKQDAHSILPLCHTLRPLSLIQLTHAQSTNVNPHSNISFLWNKYLDQADTKAEHQAIELKRGERLSNQKYLNTASNSSCHNVRRRTNASVTEEV